MSLADFRRLRLSQAVYLVQRSKQHTYEMQSLFAGAN
jgi:hypothetical protein